MLGRTRFTTRDWAFAVTFTALYVVFSFVKISPIIGLPGQAITAAAVVAPIMGIVLGPYVGALSAFFGSMIGFFLGAMGLPSVAAGVVAPLFSGLVCTGKRTAAVLGYFTMLFFFAFYPPVGPALLFPLELWFQVIGLVILVSPLQSLAVKYFAQGRGSRIAAAFFVTCLTATLAGQIAGSIAYEMIAWPWLIPDLSAWAASWGFLTVLYPLERTIIAFFATTIGVPLYSVLKSSNLLPALGHANYKEKSS